MSLALPNPQLQSVSYILTFSERMPICAIPTLEDLMISWAVLMLPMALGYASAT